MTSRVIVTGRGGTGKSTFTALAVKALQGRILLIDADPDQCLAALLGTDLEKNKVITVSEAVYKIQKNQAGKQLNSMPLAQKVDYLMQLSCVYESPAFDLLTLGVKWTRGCYCAPNNALRSMIDRLVSGYDYAIFDSPAGLEHINRRIIHMADDIFAITDPSAKGLRNIAHIAEIAAKIDFNYKNLYAVANHRFPVKEAKKLSSSLSYARYIGKLDEDHKLEQFDWTGRSMLEISQDSPALKSVIKLLSKAGYKTVSPDEKRA